MKSIRFWSVAGSIAVLAITVVMLSVMLVRQQTRLIELTAQIDAISNGPAVDAAESAESAGSPTTERPSWTYEPGVLHVDGAVERPGMYNMPIGSGITAGRLIAAAGRGTSALRVTVRPIRDSAARIDEWRAEGREVTTWDGAACMVFVHDPAAKLPLDGPKLRPDDTIWVAPR